jgi:protein TonB
MKAIAVLALASLVGPFGSAQNRDKPIEPVKIACPIPISRIAKRVPPEYPPIARQSLVQGKVRLRVTIGRDGKVKAISVISGHPLLIKASIDAVAQWEYKPLLINEKAVETETIITVIYELPKEEKRLGSR